MCGVVVGGKINYFDEQESSYRLTFGTMVKARDRCKNNLLLPKEMRMRGLTDNSALEV